MKKCILIACLLFAANALFAQVESPVKLSYSAKKIDNLTYEIHITAEIQKGWHTYSQFTPDGGPLPTLIKFVKNPLVTLTGKVKEVGKMEEHHEKLFGVNVKQFNDKVDFVQTIKLRKAVNTNLGGSIEYMACDDVHCLPPALVKFSVPIQ